MAGHASATPPLPVAELTLRAIAIGLVLSVVMGAANVYLGLKAGLTVSASIPAAVMGSLLLRMLSGRASILEANQVQTAASAGESLAAGIIFTVPALLLIGYWQSFEWWSTTLIAFTGGLLGILFMIPMRRVFVSESPELPYPEAVACAAVLETSAGDTPERSPQGATAATASRDATSHEGAAHIVRGGVLGAAFKVATSGLGILAGTLEGARVVGERVLFLGADMSPALVAVGFIVRLNVALLVGLGGVIGWLICMPLLAELRAMSAWLGAAPAPALDGSAVEQAYTLWSSEVRFIGVGAMAVGGLTALLRVRTGLARAVGELRRAGRGHPASLDARDRDLPPRVTLPLMGVAITGVIAVYLHFTGAIAITLVAAAAMLVLAFFFVAVASYIVGLVGNSNSPVSGMTITAVLITGLALYLLGYTGMQGMVATLGVAAIVCCAACTSGDICNDMKTGSLVGASPYRQQIMQVLGVAVASVVMAPVLQLLQGAYTIGSKELSAPQAQLFASLVTGFFGDGQLPWGMVGIGGALGVSIAVLDTVLAARGARFRAHLMPIAVGIYLPFGLAIPIAFGGVLAHLQGRRAEPADVDRVLRPGVLFSSGVIAGEALTGVAIALVITGGQTALTALAAVAAAAGFYLFTRPGRTETRAP